MSRLAVDNPAGLAREPWKEHLEACAACRQEAADHSRALSVFRAIESELLAGKESALQWEEVQAAIQREEAGHQTRARGHGWWGIPVAAAAAGVLATASVMSWDAVMDDGLPAPARIVSVEPPAQRRMEQTMRWMFGQRRPDADPSLVDARPRADALHAPPAPAELPANPDFAVDFSPLPQEPVRRQPLPVLPVDDGVPAVVMRRTPPPLRNGRGRDFPPLFRLEHRVLPTQPVGLSTTE